MTRRIFYLAVILTGLSFFVAPGALADEPAPGPQESAAADEVDEEVLRSESELLAKAAEIAEQVAEIRGLPLKKSIPKGVQDRDELRDMLVHHFEEEISAEEFEAEARVFRLMGLFDEDFDYRELMLDLYTEQIAGFYDQSQGELYIMRGLPEPLQKLTMAHEIFHAIQDQHFDIGAMLAPFESQENSDFFLARMALIEGDATVLMFDYELYERGDLPQNRARSFIDVPMMAAILLELDATDFSAVEQMRTPDAVDIGADGVPSLTDSVLGQAPPIVRDTMLFPYVDGMKFVIRARAGRTWSEFDRIYYEPPVSTSQILHPELYFDEIYPLEIRFDVSGALPGYEMIYEKTFGELHIRSWLTSLFSEVSRPPDVQDIAQGWMGDRLKAYESPNGELIAVHLSTWDSDDNARDFAETLKEGVRLRHETTSVHQRGRHGESWCMRSGSQRKGQRICVERWGELVLYVEGAPSMLDDQGQETNPALYLVRQALWDTHQRLPFEEVLAQRKAELEDRSEGQLEDQDHSDPIPAADEPPQPQ